MMRRQTMTTSKELVLKAFRREAVDKIPVVPPFQGYWAMGLAGVTVRQSIDRPDLAAKAQYGVAESCGFDGMETMWDWLSPVEALGCEIKIPEFGTIPTWKGIIDEPSMLDQVEIPEPKKDYRHVASKKTTEHMIKALGKQKFLYMTTVCPFTLAGEIRGVETIMLDTLTDPDFVTKLIKFSTEVMKAYTKDIVREAVDGVIICDPTASGSLISKTDYLRFVQPYQKELGKIVKGSDKYLLLHMCGDTSDRLDAVQDVGAHVFSLDYQVDLAIASKIVAGEQTILGNVKPAQTLFSGTQADVRKESLECIAKFGRKGFILGAGCDIAPGTPLQNVETWKNLQG
jgi:MtaA/CmuA family methyltransferase